MILPLPNRAISVLGIDLGTTFSTVSLVTWAQGMAAPQCRCLEIEQTTKWAPYTSPLVPSVVAVAADEIWVGEGARRLKADDADHFREGVNVFTLSKNYIGLQYTYPSAPEFLNEPWKVSSAILKHLYSGALKQIAGQPDRIVISVPASFQLNQRRDTLRAAELAGIPVNEYDLLDEPTAALYDSLIGESPRMQLPHGAGNIMVFDFGGGTCDVSIVRSKSEQPDNVNHLSMLSASRYHRLGGSDIDSAIVHEVLIPQLREQNDLDEYDLHFDDSKDVLEPQLIAAASSLKHALCDEATRLTELGRFSEEKRNLLEVQQPSISCKFGEAKSFVLDSPKLSFTDFNSILRPYLAEDVLIPRQGEFYDVTSILAPITDALSRARLTPGQIDHVLMTGGSSMIVQVQDALKAHFPTASSTVPLYADDAQLQVSRGAALEAFHLATTNQPIIHPILSDSIVLLATNDERVNLVEAGTKLPYPSDKNKFAEVKDRLVVPRRGMRELELSIVSGSTDALLMKERWKLPQSVDQGDPIAVSIRVTENQVLELRAYLPMDRNHKPFMRELSNPLINIVNPGNTRLKILELEETLRTRHLDVGHKYDTHVQLAKSYAELNQLRRAISNLDKAEATGASRSVYSLNLKGIYWGRLGQRQRQILAYESALEIDPTDEAVLFNISLAYEAIGHLEKALEYADRALQQMPLDPPYITNKASILKSLAREAEANNYLAKAAECFTNLEGMDTFQKAWYRIWARKSGSLDKLKIAEETWNKSAEESDNGIKEDLRPAIIRHGKEGE